VYSEGVTKCETTKTETKIYRICSKQRKCDTLKHISLGFLLYFTKKERTNEPKRNNQIKTVIIKIGQEKKKKETKRKVKR